MATNESFPRPYVNTVPSEQGGDTGLMQYTRFPTMGIGARNSGLPKDASQGPKSLDHVGKSATGKRGK